jgi:hypothetical protein
MGKRDTRATLSDGLSISAVSTLDLEFLRREIYEQNVYLRHGLRLEEGDTVIDCGGNIGLFTIFAAGQVGSKVDQTRALNVQRACYCCWFSVNPYFAVDPHHNGLSSWSQQGRVLCVEPLQRLYDAMQHNVSTHAELTCLKGDSHNRSMVRVSMV